MLYFVVSYYAVMSKSTVHIAHRARPSTSHLVCIAVRDVCDARTFLNSVAGGGDDVVIFWHFAWNRPPPAPPTPTPHPQTENGICVYIYYYMDVFAGCGRETLAHLARCVHIN